MRVIGGEFRSRVLKSLPGLDVRPTPDRLREALFNILRPRIADAVFVDAYAGTGAVGIEALSRGAARAIFIEQNHAAVQVIRENLRSLGLTDRAQIRSGRAAKLIEGLQADIVFLDPPYHLENEYAAALRALSDTPPALVIAQHSSRFDPGDSHGSLNRTRVLKQGDNSLSFYSPLPASDAGS
jgi:16S rRNA (guanine(966)-N(2))-methyltransferase RsmD